MNIDSIKKLVARTPLHKVSMDIKADIELSRFPDVSDRIIGNKTVYCISPYKTATRYLSGSYKPEISAHECLHYLSLRDLDKNFNDFFIRRLNTLNLKLECSGFLSAYVDELASHPLAKDLHYVVILRSPSSWITSSVNYWDYLNKTMRMNYHYTNVLFWMNKVGVNLDTFFNASHKERNEGLENLSNFYLNYTRKTKKLKNVHYVDIKEIDSFLPTLDKLIDETSYPKQSNIGAYRNKTFHYKNDKLDEEYNKLVTGLTRNI